MKLTDKYLTVTALTKYIKKKMEIDPHLQVVSLQGEISNFNHHSRGHMYLTIKDNHSRIQAVMFAGNNRFLKFIPENGMKVLIKGEVNVFEPYGQYQLYIREMQPDGIGALYLAYEQLKDKFSKAGFFDERHKREIRQHPTNIGLITSPTGAAVRDIITTIKRRYPIVQLTLLPVLVQGEEAPMSIIAAIERANTMNLFDTLIVGRGGGSIEDLWAFNEEKVAKAIFNSEIPVITGIGHETDMTISDFVADLRAATPTGAAELAVPSLFEVRNTIHHLTTTLSKLVQLTTIKKSESLQAIKKSYAFHLPKQLINEKEQHIDTLNDKLENRFETILNTKLTQFEHVTNRLRNEHPKRKIVLAAEKLESMKEAFNKGSIHILQQKQIKLNSLIDKLTLLNPLYIMKRGFALPYTKHGKLLNTTLDVEVDDRIQVRLSDGSIHCKVQEVWRDEDGIKK